MIVPFKAEHLKLIKLQTMQASAELEFDNIEYGKALENSYAYSLIKGGEVICAGGIMDVWQGRATAWALVGKEAGKYFSEIHKNCAAAIRLHPAKRIEMAVHVDFEEAHRWALMLGMKCETPDTVMKAYLPDGSDCKLYARIKG